MRCGSRSIASKVFCQLESGHDRMKHRNGDLTWSSSIDRQQWKFRGLTNQGLFYWWERVSDGETRIADQSLWAGRSPVHVVLFPHRAKQWGSS